VPERPPYYNSRVATISQFARERETYEREKQNLLQWEGEYVVICGDEILGHWASRDEAYRTGRRTYGRRLFMLAQIERHGTIYFQPDISFVADGELE
jgi:hypothetical protein